jgi:hypothetical protein
MTDRPHDPAEELAALFALERSYEETPSPEVMARVRAGVRLRVSPGGTGDGPPPGGRAVPGTMATSKAIAGMILTFLLGAGAGVALVKREPTPLRPVSLEAVPGSVVLVAPPLEPVAPPTPELVAPRTPSPEPRASGSATPTSRASVVADGGGEASVFVERGLLDAARVALAAGAPGEALEAVARHARDFPQGQLTEEREAIAVRALVKAGRDGEARARGTRFLARYPRSVAAPAVRAAIDSTKETP